MKTILFAAIALILFCTVPPGKNVPAAIPVEHERICPYPISGAARLEEIASWPSDSMLSAPLLAQIDHLHRSIVGEFRRCEKYGLYRTVDSTRAPTKAIFLSLANPELEESGLCMDIMVEVHDLLSNKQQHSQTLSFCSRTETSGTGVGDPSYHHLGKALAAYRRNFPVGELVGLFYPLSLYPLPSDTSTDTPVQPLDSSTPQW
jgi:hypothetical protein